MAKGGSCGAALFECAGSLGVIERWSEPVRGSVAREGRILLPERPVSQRKSSCPVGCRPCAMWCPPRQHRRRLELLTMRHRDADLAVATDQRPCASQSRMRWWAMAPGGGDERSLKPVCLLTSSAASSRLNHRQSSISRLSMAIFVDAASP